MPKVLGDRYGYKYKTKEEAVEANRKRSRLFDAYSYRVKNNLCTSCGAKRDKIKFDSLGRPRLVQTCEECCRKKIVRYWINYRKNGFKNKRKEVAK